MKFALGYSYNSVVQYWIVNFVNDPGMLQRQKVERSGTNWLILRSYTHRAEEMTQSAKGVCHISLKT